MYLWKCWRDTRYPFLAAAALFVLSYAFYCLVFQDWFGWFRGEAFAFERLHWQQAAEATIKIASVLSLFAGFVLGGEGLAEEFPKKTLPFLLTRPRSRTYWLWMNWAVGATEVIFLVAFAFFLYTIRPSFPNHPNLPFHGGGFLRVSAALGTIDLVLYCLTFTMGMLFRSGRNGTRAAVGICVVYSIMVQAWGIPLPTFTKLMDQASLSASTPAKVAYPLLLTAGWLSAALGLAVIAYAIFRRRDL